jgi:hypothetical protein
MSTAGSITDPMSEDTRELIIAAALSAIGNASVADTLSFLGPQTLAEESRELITRGRQLGVRPLTPSNVAFHFAKDGTSRQFDRDALVNELVDRACDRVANLAQTSARRYVLAAQELVDSQSAEPVHDAIAADMASYRPGGEELAGDAGARVYYLAVAMCDLDKELAGKLRATDTVTDGTFIGVYEEFLELTGREPIEGYETRDLALLISMLLNGEEIRYRYKNTLPAEMLSDAVMRIFWAFTVPCGAPTKDIEAELIASIQERPTTAS